MKPVKCRPLFPLMAVLLLAACDCSDDSDDPPEDDPSNGVNPPIVSSDNVESLLKAIIDTGNADDFEAMLPYVQRVVGSDYMYEASASIDGMTIIDDQTIVQNDTIEQIIRTTVFSCDAGGQFTRVMTVLEGSGQDDIQGTVERCRLDDLTLDGGFSGISYRGRHSLLLDEFSVTEGDGSRQVVDAELYKLDFAQIDIDWRGTHETYDISGNLVKTVTGADLAVDTSLAPETSVSPVRRRWNASFELTAPVTNDQPMQVNTLSVFENDSQPGSKNYLVGQLEATAADGSSLLLDADTGMIDTFSVTIDNEDGTEEITLDWLDDLRLRCEDIPGSFSFEPPISTCL